jgi:hypothetical protein
MVLSVDDCTHIHEALERKGVALATRDATVRDLQVLATNFPRLRQEFSSVRGRDFWIFELNDLRVLERALANAMRKFDLCDADTLLKLRGKLGLDGVPVDLKQWLLELEIVLAAIRHQAATLDPRTRSIVLFPSPHRRRRGDRRDESRYVLACAVGYVLARNGVALKLTESDQRSPSAFVGALKVVLPAVDGCYVRSLRRVAIEAVDGLRQMRKNPRRWESCYLAFWQLLNPATLQAAEP